MLATAAAAEPGKAPAPAEKQPAPAMLAQADNKMPVPAKVAEASPVKRRAARVTSCRCADVAAAPQPQN
jgi:hypothetical protein